MPSVLGIGDAGAIALGDLLQRSIDNSQYEHHWVGVGRRGEVGASLSVRLRVGMRFLDLGTIFWGGWKMSAREVQARDDHLTL